MASPSTSTPEAVEGDLWKHKFKAIERMRKEAQAERDILQKQLRGLKGNESIKNYIPACLQKLYKLEAKVSSLEEELESLRTLHADTSSIILEDGEQVAATVTDIVGPPLNKCAV